MSHAGQGPPPKRELHKSLIHMVSKSIEREFCYVVKHYHFKTVYSSFLFDKCLILFFYYNRNQKYITIK